MKSKANVAEFGNEQINFKVLSQTLLSCNLVIDNEAVKSSLKHFSATNKVID